ncbi:MAG TPA: hypothetical protein VL096_14650, partial [Pirellulaceae bacterium]|nr:hypothetical protein [Pirellulaceae bacterium]
MWNRLLPIALLLLLVNEAPPVVGQSLTWQETVKAESPESLAQAALADGDALRGAIVFFQPHLACSKCHDHASQGIALAPNLTLLDKTLSDAHLIQ